MSRRLRDAAALLAGAALLASAAQAATPPREPGAKPDLSTDEGGLWQLAERAETDARRSAELDRDPALNSYVGGVACKVGPTYCQDIRVYVMDRPYFNATMSPNGYTEIWSGLLLRVEDESQLAFVLAHETSHFAQNHTVATWRRAKAASTAALFLAIGTAAVGVPVVGNIAYLGALASIFSFSREQETEADQLGFARATAAGYDPTAGQRLWQALTEEVAQSDFEKIRLREARGGAFNTHPITADRIKALGTMAAGKPPGEGLDRKRYRAVIRPHLAAWLRDDLRRKDFGQSLVLIDRLLKQNEDLGVLQFYKGEAYRIRRKDGDLALARDAYLAATGASDAPVGTWRELGDMYAALGEKPQARDAYQTYLDKAAGADDRWLVEQSLQSLNERTT